MSQLDKFTESPREVLTPAQDQAEHFKQEYVGTKQLLPGLVREGEGIAAGELAVFGVNLRKVRSTILLPLKHPPGTE